MLTTPVTLALAWNSPHGLTRTELYPHRWAITRARQVQRLTPTSPFQPVPLQNIIEESMEKDLDDFASLIESKPAAKGKAFKGGSENTSDSLRTPNAMERTTNSDAPRPMKETDAASIIAGTAIGGGFLALPSVTTPIGYLPTLCGLAAVWSFLLLSAIAFVESAGLVADARSRGGVDSSQGGGDTDGTTSVATVIQHAFGKKWALLGGMAFVAQMLAVVTAQVVRGGELSLKMVGLPYAVGCIFPSFLIGLFAFSFKPELVEGANTLLTGMMIGGFSTLVFSTVTSGNLGPEAGSLFTKANWSRLLPRMHVSWTVPVFINLLCYGQSMPLVVERMVQGQHIGRNKTSVERATLLTRTRLATTIGSLIPLSLSVVWAAISTALVAPSSPDPLYSLLWSGPSIAIPVTLLCMGAIGTTLLGSYLAMGHFACDILSTKFGFTSNYWMTVAQILTVAIPCILALAGPGLYIPLMSFAGAYPTTLLYGLAPSLAVIVLRRRARMAGIMDGSEGTTPRLVPGGTHMLAMLAATALSIIGASTVLALQRTWHTIGLARI